MSDLETKILLYMFLRLRAGSKSISVSEIVERFNLPFDEAVQILEKLCYENMVIKIPSHPFCGDN